MGVASALLRVGVPAHRLLEARQRSVGEGRPTEIAISRERREVTEPRYNPQAVRDLLQLFQDEGVSKESAEILVEKMIRFQNAYEDSGKNPACLHFIASPSTLKIRVFEIQPDHEEKRTQYMRFEREELPMDDLGPLLATL